MLDELKTFIAVVEQENFTKAAKLLKISQPSVSVHIKNLEEYFNTILLSRSVKAKKNNITESGKLVYTHAKKIINTLEDLVIEIADTTEITGRINVGSIQTVMERFMPEFLDQFFKKYPGINVNLLSDTPDLIAEKVASMKYNVGISVNLTKDSNLNESVLLEDKILLITPPDHPISDKNLTTFDFSKERFILREQGSATRGFIDDFFTNNQIDKDNAIIISNNYAVISAVSKGIGISLMSSMVCNDAVNEGQIKTFDIGETFSRSVTIMSMKEPLLSKATKVFIEELKAFCSSVK